LIKFANPLLAIDFFPGATTHINFWRTGGRERGGEGRGFDTFSTDVKDEERNARQLSCTAAWIYRSALAI